MALQMLVRGVPCDVGPLGISIGSPMRAMSSTGTSMRTSSAFFAPASTTVTGRNVAVAATSASRSSGLAVCGPSCSCARSGAAGLAAPPRNRATSSSGRCVADSPTRCSGRPHRCSSRSSDRARCAPRLVGTSAWISSTMTVSTARRASRLADVRSRYSDSGVVIRMSAGSRLKRARSDAGVSPVRTEMAGITCGTPSRAATLVMPATGARRLRTSAPSSPRSSARGS